MTTAAGLENMGLRWYRVKPGEDIPITGMHYHDTQEEAFYVVEGELRVETPDREYQVGTGVFFIAEPESPHRAYNSPDATEDAIVVAMGAPAMNDGHAYTP